jgi:hypothetical protein
VHAEFLSRDICCLEIDGEYLVKTAPSVS